MQPNCDASTSPSLRCRELCQNRPFVGLLGAGERTAVPEAWKASQAAPRGEERH
jgi:hypothetical protein